MQLKSLAIAPHGINSEHGAICKKKSCRYRLPNRLRTRFCENLGYTISVLSDGNARDDLPFPSSTFPNDCWLSLDSQL